ncbi:MAG: PAC2 family protein, partial [Phycisphaeraceae bacterium]|nr:PAC2 family protein [Phycisphaeraceae bacterium]
QEGYVYSQKLLDLVSPLGIERIFTFAAMASQLHPSANPSVYAVATAERLLAELEPIDDPEVHRLPEGQISGLNGVFLGAAAARGIDGIGLLGQIPFFAAGVPSPRASQMVLQVFERLLGLELDHERLIRQADRIEKVLLDALNKLKDGGEDGQDFTVPDFLAQADGADEEEPEASVSDEAAEPELSPAQRQRLEGLFTRARDDREAAMELKQELDRLGVFDQYEDRFLDLFRRAE